MIDISARRASLPRVLGAACALAVTAAGLTLGTGAGVANADPSAQYFVSTGFDRTVPVRTTGGGQDYRPLTVQFTDRSELPLRGVKVAVDGSALRGFAELDLPAGCAYTSADHLRESCALGDARYGAGQFSVGVRAVAQATAGRHGRVAFGVTAANGTESPTPSAHDTIGVTVGDGADLVINDLGRSYKVTPGGTTALPLRLTNAGSRDGKGIVVFLHDQYGRSGVLGNYSNCVYEHYDNAQRGAYCTFPDTVIAPGQTLQLSDPFTISTPAGAHSDEIQYGAGLLHDAWIGTPDGTPGTGGPLTLVQAPAATSRTYQYDPSKDIDEYNNLYYTRLDTGTVTDIAGIDGSLDAVIGTDTPVTFRVRNSGTTTISQYDKNLKGSVGVAVDFPSTVRVTHTPPNCRTLHGGPEGLSSYPMPKEPVVYFCARTTTLKPGQTVGFTFQVVALKAVSGTYAGMVAVADEDPTADELDNSARTTINASAAATASPAASATPTANAPSANGDQGGRLAATGSGSATLWMAVGGAGVLAAGAAALTAARRRRVPAQRD